MEKCLVTKLDASVDIQNPEYLIRFKDFADLSINEQRVQIVGAGLPVTDFTCGTRKVKVTFVGLNNNTMGVLFNGCNINSSTGSENNRMRLDKPYKASSSGESTYIVQSSYGAGVNNGDDVTLDKDVEYTVLMVQGSATYYNKEGQVVATQTYTESNNSQIDTLYISYHEDSASRKDMFALKNFQIMDLQDNLLLDVYPALDEQGKGCLFDVVNGCYYYANTTGTHELNVWNEE